MSAMNILLGKEREMTPQRAQVLAPSTPQPLASEQRYAPNTWPGEGARPEQAVGAAERGEE